MRKRRRTASSLAGRGVSSVSCQREPATTVVVRTASHDGAHPVQEATAASQNVMTPTRGLADNATESDAAEQSRTARRPRGAGVIKYLLRRVLGWIGMIFLATNLGDVKASKQHGARRRAVERMPRWA